VVVKVQYEEVEGLVRLDVRNLRTAARLIARREPTFDYRAVVEELAQQVPLELDFVREAEMTRRVAANLAGVPGIVVPEVIDGYVTRRVLVTEYLPGVRLLERGVYRGGDGPAVAERIAGAYGKQVLIDGLFQADPHPGNLILMPDGRVGLVDFGLTKELPDGVRLGFARLVLAAAERDVAAILAALGGLGVRTRSKDPGDVLALMSLFFDTRDPALRGSAYRERTSEALNRSPLDAIPGDLVLLGRVVGLLRGVCASLGAPLSPMQMLKPWAERALAVPSAAGKGLDP
jgi:predicted unusual protein kinase regulating ubiquinone biosynthesis (AarF/ABC1/UbiB family)